MKFELYFGGIAVINNSATFTRYHVLRVAREHVKLEGIFLKDLTFKIDEVVKLERFGVIPYIWRGIKIKAENKTFKGDIRFHCWKNPEKMRSEINEFWSSNKVNVNPE